MAWGILMAGMTVFGMLGLLIAAIRADEGSTQQDLVGSQAEGCETGYKQAA